MFHWVFVILIIAYFWWLATRVAKPKPSTISEFDRVKSPSKAVLWLQIIAAWVFVLAFGLYTLSMIVMMPRHHAAPGDTSGQITDLVFAIGIPYLFALSVRWSRSLMAKWKALEASAGGPKDATPEVK
jgi:hypothetical protein